MERLRAALLDAFEGKNEAEFKQNYSENTCGWNAVRYEDCALDFVPVTEREYLVVDRSEDRLCGTYTVSPYVENEKTEKTITSLLIADEWDVRKALPVVLEKRWTNVYFVLNEAAPKFASFFKLKGFLASLPPNVRFFATTEEMRRYFLETPGAYLPRKIAAPEEGKYEELIEELHEARIRSGVPSDHVLLSICIPTYNRGNRALHAVRQVLTSEYDAEIEVVLCNNGSTIETESYGEIREIQDSRLSYYEFETNGGFVVSYCDCIKKPKGQFALFLSDEDPLAVKNLEKVLEYLNDSQNIGVISFSPALEVEEDGIFVREQQIFKAGREGIEWVLNWTRYFSGTCFNMNLVRQLRVLDELEKYQDNYFICYPQCVIAMLLACRADTANSEIGAWFYGEPEKKGGDIEEFITEENMWTYAFPEERMKQERGTMILAGDLLNSDDAAEFFQNHINHIFDMISGTYKLYGKQWVSMFRWTDVWMSHYRNCLQILKDLEGKINVTPEVIKKMDKSFFYWIICKREQRWHTPEENLLPCLQAQVAKYYYDKGTPIEEIDFQGIEKDLEGWVQDFLSKRS